MGSSFCEGYSVQSLFPPTLGMIVFITLLGIEYGPMRKHEENAIVHGDLYTTPDRPFEGQDGDVPVGKGRLLT